MRAAVAVLVVLATGCPEHGSRPNGSDGGLFPDGGQTDPFCTGGPANVTLSSAATIEFMRLAAGGIWQTGPFNAAQPPMTIDLLFTNVTMLDAAQASCCINSDATCCAFAGVVAHSAGAVPFGSELGSHAFNFSDTKNNFSITGNVKIDVFTQPFLSRPGRIAGSISAISGGRTISGTFDSSFCDVLLSQTI
jgi:hypothetical protein